MHKDQVLNAAKEITCAEVANEQESHELPEELRQYFSEYSWDVLENFGIEAPALVNEYACKVEDAFIKTHQELLHYKQENEKLQHQLRRLYELLHEEEAKPQTDD